LDRKVISPEETQQKREERESKLFYKFMYPTSDIAQMVPFQGGWQRSFRQRCRRTFEKGQRYLALKKLGPIDHLAHLVIAMEWHRYHTHILIVATHPGVTSHELTETYGLEYPNHRMIFRRLNKDLERIGWHFVSYPIDVQNKPWGWELEKI
jgi:hypothetical protein